MGTGKWYMLEQHRVVDLLMGSGDQIFEEWLQAHRLVTTLMFTGGCSLRRLPNHELRATKDASTFMCMLCVIHIIEMLVVHRSRACSFPSQHTYVQCLKQGVEVISRDWEASYMLPR
jgi:hypothetical protein